MSPLRMIYLGLAVVGAVLPMSQFLPWVDVHGLDLPAFLDAVQINAASKAVFWDLTISAVVLSVFVIAEVAVRRNWIALIAIPVTFAVGLSCGLPLYLFLRTRPVA